ncbi:MAG: hypothetical protein JOZ81_27165 [Chloroflexi bacterium]|nr:hypothetical protein [Chloroflexota bacterium]
MRLSGWRAALWGVLALITLMLLLSALFWIGMALAVLAVVAWFNLVILPRIGGRLHVSQLVLAALLLPLLGGIGYIFDGVAGVGGGCALWVIGVALPRAALWRARKRFRYTAQRPMPVRIIEPDFRYRP